jgi:hypothetical protein
MEELTIQELRDLLDTNQYDTMASAGWEIRGDWEMWSIGGHGLVFRGADEREALECAYTHYRHEKKFQAMEAFVQKIAEMEIDDEIQDHVAEAQAILGNSYD